jgi:long-chain fatty acid transport protein
MLVCCLGLMLASPLSAQTLETVGSRALGMGGAFVAIADDSSATWWNPAGLAAGPFADLALGVASADNEDGLSARRERAGWFTLATPPLGLSYYRLKFTNIGQIRPIGPDSGGREDRGAAVPAWSVSASQFGVTLVQTLIDGVHVGTTLKYLRLDGASMDVVGLESDTTDTWLDRASGIDTGAGNAFDLDAGVLAVRGPLRVGAVVKNVREAGFDQVRLPRQVRVGAAVEAARIGLPVTLAIDADARAYATPLGRRRQVALGAEGWVMERRVGLRAGARFGTTGSSEQTYTAGASVAIASGLYAEAHVAAGGARGEGGWGVAARASF